eukprot:10962732-Alexandrium_andersonii.AAC.1
MRGAEPPARGCFTPPTRQGPARLDTPRPCGGTGGQVVTGNRGSGRVAPAREAHYVLQIARLMRRLHPAAT